MRILIVDDEKNIQDVLVVNLEMEGFECVALSHGRDVAPLLDKQHFDVILLDIMLPETSGYEICQQVKVNHPDIPIIFLSAKDEHTDKVQGLKKGADDYITKPFHMEELLLRIQNVTRRYVTQNEGLQKFHFGDNWVDFQRYMAHGPGGEIILTKKELLLLRLFIENINQVLTRKQILSTVWGYDIFPTTRTIDNFILSFRKYFEKDPRRPEYFYSIRGVGYKLMLPVPLDAV